jgi:superoxide dismutase, Cu-Zn family
MQCKPIYICCLIMLAGLGICGCDVGAQKAAAPASNTNDSTASIKQAVAVIHATAGNRVSGKVQFDEAADGKVKVLADLEGLTPNQQHGFHIHQFGDCTATDAASAGDHYNPVGTPHALPATQPRHAGDLGNLQADASGKAHYEITVDTLSVAGSKPSVIGRAVIVHEKPDTGVQPTGGAGNRLGCGVIGIAKPSR